MKSTPIGHPVSDAQPRKHVQTSNIILTEQVVYMIICICMGLCVHLTTIEEKDAINGNESNM